MRTFLSRPCEGGVGAEHPLMQRVRGAQLPAYLGEMNGRSDWTFRTSHRDLGENMRGHFAFRSRIFRIRKKSAKKCLIVAGSTCIAMIFWLADYQKFSNPAKSWVPSLRSPAPNHLRSPYRGPTYCGVPEETWFILPTLEKAENLETAPNC